MAVNAGDRLDLIEITGEASAPGIIPVLRPGNWVTNF